MLFHTYKLRPVSKLSGLDEVDRACNHSTSVAEAGSGGGLETSFSYTSKIEV